MSETGASGKFLAAWEAAGKPPVKKLIYPRYGRGRDRTLFKHAEIMMFARQEDVTFHDNGEDVKLSWTYGDPGVEHSDSGSTELYFDRANPIPAPSPIGRLATLCDESGLTRSDIAGRAGLSPGNLSRLLGGSRPGVSMELVGRVLDAIGCQWGDLD